MQAPVLQGHLLDGSDPAAIAQAAALIAAGELVAFPTETVYGLGARADDDAAVAKIFAAKGRPSNHPLIVHVLDLAGALPFADSLPPVARRLVDAFWPGPLTLIVRRAAHLGQSAAGGQDSIGLRCPSHPVARALLAAAAKLGVAGIAAPSANRFGRVSPTQPAHVVAEFGDTVPVLTGGSSELGIESCIVDCTRGRLVLLRPGTLTLAQIEAAAGEPVHERDAQAPRASGTLESHYAPRAAVHLMSSATLQARLTQVPSGSSTEDKVPKRLAVYSRTVVQAGGAPFIHRAMPAEAGEAAHELFAVLRAFDDEGVESIWVEEPPADPGWDGVRDRLRRAAAR